MHREQKLIGIDFDDVIHNFNNGLMTYYNTRFNTSFKREQVTEYYIEKLYGVSQTEMFEIINDFCLSDDHHHVEPLIGAQEVIKNLALKHNLIIITARPQTLDAVTRAWLDVHFPDIFHEIHYTRESWKHSKKNKSEIAQNLDIDYFIEDSIENAEDMARIGIQGFLLDAPWNQGIVPKGVTRIHSWKEIEKFVV